MNPRRLHLRALLLPLVLFASLPAAAADITNASLEIQGIGLSLVVQDPPVTTGIDIPTTIQTKFGGKENEQALTVEGLRAVGDLTGPGLDSPLELSTAPGHKFQIPGLSREGTYTLQNVRLMKGNELLQYASPSAADIIVAELFKTTVEVKQLTPEEIRARGIVIDPRNFEVYEYTLSFLLRGDVVKIPFPVIIDPRTRQIQLMPVIQPYTLPPIGTIGVGRWTPPEVIPVTFEDDKLPEDEGNSPKIPKEPGEKLYVRPPIPAAIVIPNSLAVMHQFFVVQLSVQNGAPSGSTARLENVTARIKVPQQLRNVSSKPAVSIGQAVPLVDKVNGLTVLVAQAKAEAEWNVEALKPGTHTIEIELRGLLKENGQEDVPVVARPRASVVVHDPRFNIAFSHPDTVRKGIDYTTYSFITNTSPAAQTIILSNSVPPCTGATILNVCRVDGGIADERTIPSGETVTIEYKLRSGVTGKVFATAAHIESEVANATAQLHMGVSDTGVPLSPTTLIMPHYAQYVSPSLVDESMQILGLGYSLATAAVTSATAKLPRVIKSDVYRRAVDIAQAGQAIFIANDAPGSKADAYAALAVDLLGNSIDLAEWDALRRQQKYARPAGAAVTRELELNGFPNGTTYSGFIDNFAKALSHRNGYVAALVHAPKIEGNVRPFALSVRGMTSNRRMDIPAEVESGWVRDLPYGELTRIAAPGSDRAGEFALIGRWTTEDLEVVVTPSVDGAFQLELLFPDTNDGSTRRAHFDVAGTKDVPIRIPISRGAGTINALTPSGGFADTDQSVAVPLEQLRVVGMRQDLYLDPNGKKVSILFNRPVEGGVPAKDLREKFHGEIDFNKDGVVWMDEERPITGAALQETGRVIDLTFEHVLTTNADQYTIEIQPLVDPRTTLPVSFPGEFIPKIDNNRPAGIIYGRFVRGDNTPLAQHEVILFSGQPNPFTRHAIFEEFENPKRRIPVNPFFQPPQITTTKDDGSYFFEYVPRSMEEGFPGEFRLWGNAENLTKYTYVEGAVRLPGRVHHVSLQLLGRGSAEGTVRFDNGEIAKNVNVTVGSTAFEGVRTATTDVNGFYRVEDLPVGPLAFTATDGNGNIGYAAGEIATPGEIEQQDISIFRQPVPKNGSVHGTIRRSDTNAPVMGASVGIFNNGYPLMTLTTDVDGRYTAEKVPAGFISVVAAEWNVSRISANTDFDLRGDEVRQVDLTLSVAPNQKLTTVTGVVLRDDPLFPGNPAKYQRVANALVKIDNMRIVTANELGEFVIPDVPLSASGTNIGAHDPSTRRTERVQVPVLTEAGPNHVPILLRGLGKGTVRARLFDAHGAPAAGFEMLLKAGGAYFVMEEVGGGVYSLDNVGVGDYQVRTGAVPAEFGDQEVTSTTVRVAFDGHVVSTSLRLPGQGEVRANVKQISLPTDGSQPILTPLITDVTLTYSVFNSSTLTSEPKEILGTTNQNGLPGEAIFGMVPAHRAYTVSSNHPLGTSSEGGRLAFDADLGSHTLFLSNLGHIIGTVYAIDGVTPVPGATVRLDDEHQDQGIVITGLDGKFEFRNVAPGARIILTAESTQAGIYRTGERRGNIPSNGGVVQTSITLLERGQIEGKIVYGAYKVYDPLHPENNVPDNTPNDLSDNAPVPMARFWMKELDFPRRDIGTGVQPLNADLKGQFAIDNIFVGRLRATAWDPSNPDLRGDWTGSIVREGELLTPYIAIGGGGTGAILAKVTNPNANNAPVETAEVQLFRGHSLFDLASSGPDGTVQFEQVPVGTYTVTAYSKALGKSGKTQEPVVVTVDEVTEARVMLTFSGEVTGRLTDPESTPEANKPIQGAHVTISMAEGFQTRYTTGPLGEYIFEGVREGLFTLDAKDTTSNRRARKTYLLSAADPEPVVNLELERTETLHIGVYLPDDFGANSNVLAGEVEAEVKQRNGDFRRAMQGNPIVMPKLFLNESYEISIQEVGGDRRELFHRDSFPDGNAANPIKLVYPAYGSGEVLIRRLGAAVSDARVSIRVSRFDTRVFYSDAAGRVLVHGLPLGRNYSVTVTTLDGSSGSGNLEIIRTSVLGSLTVEVGSRASVTGKVNAEAGGPSMGTPVTINFSGGQLTATTDHEGNYTFAGVAAPSGITLRFYGADGSTLGKTLNLNLGAEWAGKTYTAPTVTIDATPPLLLDIAPAQGSTTVPPDTHLKFVFSEPLNTNDINMTRFALTPADSSELVNANFTWAVGENDTFIVTMVPPAKAGQQYPLKSNTLYRLVVSQHIRDENGHTLGVDRGLTFTTADYIEPRVIATTPAEGSPIPRQITYEFRFNEPLDPKPFEANGAGRVQLDRMSGPEPEAVVVENVTGTAYVDPFTGISLFFAPDVETLPNEHYRISFSGARDLQGNVVPAHTYRFASWDTYKPFVTLQSPVPADKWLVSGLTYKLLPDIRNGDANGDPALDIDFIDYFRVENGVETFIKRVRKAPFQYDFVAPDAPVAGSTLVFRAMATDKSVNESPKAEITLAVKPNQPPTVSVALDRTVDVFAGQRVNATVAATDEVLDINLQLDVRGTRTDNTEYRQVYADKIHRNTLTDPWPAKTIAVDLPINLKDGTEVKFNGIATDMSGLTGTSMTPLTLAVDTVKPSIVSIAPEHGARFNFGTTYQIVANVTDVGTGVANVVFNVDGTTYTVLKATAVGTAFTSPAIPVVAHSVDTTVPITVTATDNSGNSISQSFEVVYVAIDDPTIPTGEWLCPISNAMLPASTSNYSLKLRFRAVDDVSVTSVRFRVPGIEQLVEPTNVATNEYEATVTINTPAADKTDYFITAIVDDANPAHQQEFRLRLSFATPDITVDSLQAITATTLPNFQDKTVVVTGNEGDLVVHVPVQFKNLIVTKGGVVKTLPTTTSVERKLDVTVTGTLYIDCASAIDVTGLGYSAANQVDGDGSGNTNTGEFGRTFGNTSTGGARSAGASHGGMGVPYNTGVTNAVYGSYTEPRTLGAGGGSNSNSNGAGTGGGAIAIAGSETSRFVIAGGIRADGEGGNQLQGGGAGGSVLLQSADVLLSRSALVTANGGDSVPGGGGRIAIYATRTLTMPENTVQARGGWNTNGEVPSNPDGGAGTIYIVKPGEVSGETENELRIVSFDTRHPVTPHYVFPTPIGVQGGPALVFGSIYVGPRSLLRIDSAYSVTKTNGEVVDPAGFLFGPEVQPVVSFDTTPAAGASVVQNGSISVTYTASSDDGIADVRVSLTGAQDDVQNFNFVGTAGPRTVSMKVPSTTAPGPITLKVRARTRSERVKEATATFTVIADAAPTVQIDSVVPATEIYAGGTIAVSASASDDIEVKSITLNASAGNESAQSPVRPTPQTMTRSFTVSVPKTTDSNTNIVLTVTASDGFPGRTMPTATHTVKVKKDEIRPTLTITKPTANQEISETQTPTFTIEALATDAEVGVETVKATFEGVTYTLNPVSGQPGRFAVSGVPVPQVDGTDPVAKTITVTASDYEPNSTEATTTIYIKPLIDANAPALAWLCSSPNAMYPAGYAVPLRVSATRPAGLPANEPFAVQRVEYSINGGAVTAMPATATTGEYAATFTIPSTETAGTVFNVRIAAVSTSNNQSTLLGTFTIVAGNNITSTRDVAANDFSLENSTVIISGPNGVLNVTGPHSFANIVVLDGGKLVQKHVSLARADQLTVGRFYLACGGSVDVNRLGHADNIQPAGIGWGDDWDGGSHIGSGSIVIRAAGGTFGSIYRPAEMGGSGHHLTAPISTIPGGGAFRLSATGSIAIDGTIQAMSGNISSGSGGTGAGGSVWLATPGTLTGAGSIDVSGGNVQWHGAGGGGAIALEYATASGTLLTKLKAYGGSASGSGRPAAAGSIYKRGSSSTFGDLTIAANTTNLYSASYLPSFGRRIVATASGSTATLAGPNWLPASVAGHWVRVIAPNGTTRGTWRIASVTNHSSARTWTASVDLKLQDAIAYDGYIVYSDAGLGAEKRRWAGARFNDGIWQYDNDSAFVTFTPAAGDVIVASFSKDATRVNDVRKAACCVAINGMPVVDMIGGEFVPNTVASASGAASADPAEIFIRSDGRNRGIILSAGSPVLTFEGAPEIQPGDVLHGVYRFDNVSLTNARVITDDLVEIGQLTKDAASTISSGNTGAPSLTASSFSFAKGIDGPVLVAPESSIVDTDGADAVARLSTTASTPTPLENAGCIVFEIDAGLTIRRVVNNRTTADGLYGEYCGASATRLLGSNGAVAFSAAQTNKEVQASLVATTSARTYNAPNHNSFRLLANGTYQVWANAANANKNGAYTASTVFRIEKAAGVVRWYVDGVRVHESTASVPSTARFDVNFNGDSGALRGVEIASSSLDLPTYHGAVAADGSFRIPLRARAGDAIVVKARDRHRNPIESTEVAAGTIPADFAITSMTFAPSEVTGGRTATGTITLPSPAGTDGVRIDLSSSSSIVTVPSSTTIAAGQTTGTFLATTTAVSTPLDASIVASWGAMTHTATLRVVKDNIQPVVTVVSPVANAQYNEGLGKIPVQANVTDADSGVKRVFATFNGTTYEMPKNTSKGANAYFVEITAPFIEGTQPQTYDVVVNATDNTDNLTTAPAVAVIVNPSTDTTVPKLEWRCSSTNAMYPVGYGARLRVYAKTEPTKPALQSVQFTVTDPSGTPTVFNAASIGNDLYEYTFTVPDVADRSVFTVTAQAVTAGGGQATLDGSFSVVKGGVELKANTTIGASDFTHDTKALVIWEGVTVTIDGLHTYDRLVVLFNGKAQSTGTKFEVNATSMYVACGGSIDATGKGYASGSTTYPGETQAGGLTGGSHIGRGGLYNSPYGSTYGSVTRPQEAGAASNGVAGGGVVKINAGTISVDGAIRANGATKSGTDPSGAGGSVWITSTRISGIGSVETNGGAAYHGIGGGGAVAIEFTDPASTLPTLSSRTGTNTGENRYGGAGSVYVKGAGATFGDLTIDNQGLSNQPTILPSFGKGIAQAGTTGATLVTNRAANIPAYFAGHWIEIYAADGALKGTWRIRTIDAVKTVTLEPNGSETINLAAGDTWQGVYRFDNLKAVGIRVESVDPIRIAGTQTIEGTVELEQITAEKLVVKGTLTHAANQSLVINADEVHVESGGAIDVSGRGYTSGNSTYPGETVAGGLTGGAHIGRGGLYNGPYGSTYGSIYRPMEAGAASNGVAGGGVLRINATKVIVDGAIRANGATKSGTDPSGAGGSVWITTNQISGLGSIETDGGRAYHGIGGGGAISIEYSDPASTLPALFSRTGTNSGEARYGGAGSVYVKGASSTYGDLTIDNDGRSNQPTILPAFGNGTAQAGTTGATLVTNRSANIPAYFVGHWVEIYAPNGTLKGTWRIATIDAAKTVTLAPNDAETITLAVGDTWQGVYRFDNLTAAGIRVESPDPIRVTGAQTIEGTVELERIDTETLIVKGTLTHAANQSLVINAEEVRVESGALIDATGKGYTSGYSTYPGESQAGGLTGGAHIGRGGLYNSPYGSTYGSIYRPMEAGAASNSVAGGGIVRIDAARVIVNGIIRANGATKSGTDPSGAGGSVWITADRITGIGSIETNGGNAYHGIGGGGAISIEFSDATSTLPTLTSRTGNQTGEHRYGGAGSIYVKGASATYGDLTIDNKGLSNQPTILPSFGKGIAQAGTTGATLVTNRSANIPAYFAGHWVEIYAPNGTLKGTWRIATIDAVKTVTLEPNGSETINLAVGDTWQGVYRFDNLKAVGIRVESPDPIRIGGTQTIEGTVELERIDTGTLIVKGTLTHAANQSLTINADEVRVESGAAIDVTGKGYTSGYSSYPNETTPGGLTGGSHIGRGGLYTNPFGSTYGSIYRPQEAGSASNGVAGGGVLRINATRVIVDGAIRANGAAKSGTDSSGAGGSVWITASRITGSGTIDTNGGNAYHGIGGGGAISIEFSDATSSLPTLTSRTGNQTGESRYGGAGSIYVKGASATYGDLTIDNRGLSNQPTILPSFGKGLAQAGTTGATLVTNRSANIPAYFAGHWIEIYAADGTLKGTWRIASIDAVKTVTLAPNGSETIDLEAGDTWQGVYRFDNLKAVGIRVESADPIRVTGTQTIEGGVETEQIHAGTVVIKGTLTHAANQSLTINADEVRVETGASIDVSGRGYTGGSTTYPGATAPGGLTGASHIGRGGLYTAPYGSTYGSLYRPMEAGSASNNIAGGGIVRINATRVVVDGTIKANGGTSSGTQPSGSGGSVWITASRITGAGSILTDGGRAYHGIGGGGAISIEFTDATSTVPTLSSRTGTNSGENRHGGAGSIYVKGAGAIYGNLTIDNQGTNGEATVLPSLGAGTAMSGSADAKVVTDRITDIPPYFAGHWVEIRTSAGTMKGTWRIASISGKTMTLAPNDNESISIDPGDLYQGVYRFDNVLLRTTKVIAADPFRSTTPVDAGSTVLDINAGPPDFSPAKRSQIVVVSAVTGDSVTGPIGAVTDPNMPLTIKAINDSGTVFNGTVNGDGSFNIPVVGAVGDTFIVSATDGHTLPLSSSVPVNGAIVESNRIATFGIQPSTVTGGTTVFGSLRLIAPARSSGGVVVALSSSDSVATVPASITVTAGATTVQFPIATSSTSTTTQVVITASIAGVSQSASFTVTPDAAALVDVVLSASTIEGGESVTGTVVLGAPAPPGGALVVLSSDTPQAGVPSTILVPEGNTEFAFTVTTSKVAAAMTATISATWGSTESATLAITKCEAMTTATPPDSATMSSVWFDDSAPTGATATGDATFDNTQTATGSLALHFAAATTIRNWTFTGAPALTVNPTDRLVLYALVNPCNPPRQILVQWSDGTTQYRASWGEERIGDKTLTKLNVGSVPAGGAWHRLEVLARNLPAFPATAKTMTGLTISVDGGEAWIDAVGVATCSIVKAPKPDYLANEVVWFDDATPPGATLNTSYSWDTSQAASGTMSDVVGSATNTTQQQHFFTNAPTGPKLKSEDVIVAYVYLDPCNPPREIMLQFAEGSSYNRRAYWGENVVDFGSHTTVQRRRIGPLPEPGKWVRLEVPVAGMQMAGTSLNGVAFTIPNGRAWFDRVGTLTRVNLALGKTADQKSIYQDNANLDAFKAVDGIVDQTNFNHSESEAQTWWEVDLGAVQPIDTIDVWNGNSDSVLNRLQNFWVFVSNTPFQSETVAATLAQSGVTGYYRLRQASRPESFEINRSGRYVRVQLAGTNFLHMSEVQVWAPVEPLRVNLSAGRTASQSSGTTFAAAQAVNGNVNGESQSQTNSELEAWWQVDLGSVQAISTIDIDNAFTSTVFPRTSNFYLFVSDSPFASTMKIADALARADVAAFYRGAAQTAYTFDVNRRGQYVRLQLVGTNILQPMEVRVWSPSLSIGALAKTPEQF